MPTPAPDPAPNVARLPPREREAAATAFRALQDNRPLTMPEALDFGLHGWNLVCARCGSYGAAWERKPGTGNSIALCPPHRDELLAEIRRHEQTMTELLREAVRQPSQADVDTAYRAYRRTRR